MKAYQIKITVKNQKPPVWRTAMIPAGITFSAFSILLNRIMGIKEDVSYMFEYYLIRLRLWEDSDPSYQISYRFDHRDAVHTYIDEYMDLGNWFNYILNDGPFLRITIINTDHGYSLTRPSVLEIRGSLPFMAPFALEVESVNAYLKSYLTFTDGEVRMQKASALAQKLKKDTPVLTFCTNPVNDPASLVKCEHRLAREALTLAPAEKEEKKLLWSAVPIKGRLAAADPYPIQGAADLTVLDKNLPYSEIPVPVQPPRYSFEPRPSALPLYHKFSCTDKPLSAALEAYSRTDLIALARRLRILRIRSLNRAQLAEKISNELLLPSVLRRRLSILTNSQLRLFDRLCRRDVLYVPARNETDNALALYENHLAILYTDGSIEIPAKVREGWTRINTPHFMDERKKIIWLDQCLKVFRMLYGAAPAGQLLELYRTYRTFQNITLSQIQEIFDEMSGELGSCVWENDVVIAKELYQAGTWKKVLQHQQDRPLFLPTRKQILSLWEKGYPVESPAFEVLSDALFACGHVPEPLLKQTAVCMNWGRGIPDAYAYLRERIGETLTNEMLTEMVTQAYSEMPLICLGGYTHKTVPNEKTPE